MPDPANDWYVCHRENNSQINCIGPFMSIFAADNNSRNDMKGATLIGVCKYIPSIMTPWYLMKRYNALFGVKNITITKV